MKCPHRLFINSVCTDCGCTCAHENFEGGKCTACGYICRHETWEDGVCIVCGYQCPHESHDANQKCLVCGKTVQHQYVNGCCKCGVELEFVNQRFDISMFDECEHAGKVETVEYASHKYNSNGEAIAEIEKRMAVYTPYGYSEDRKYNVILLMPGTGGTYQTYLEEEHDYNGYSGLMLQNLFDNIIESGAAEPFIAVGIDYSVSAGGYLSNDYAQAAYEIRNDILPALINMYSLYADSSDIATMEANRDHVAYFGASYGSQLLNTAVLGNETDIIGWFAGVCGFYADGRQAAEYIMESDYSINYYYAAAGQFDVAREDTEAGYKALTDNCSKLVNGINTSYDCIEGGEHNADTYCTALYNFLQVVFSTTFID